MTRERAQQHSSDKRHISYKPRQCRTVSEMMQITAISCKKILVNEWMRKSVYMAAVVREFTVALLSYMARVEATEQFKRVSTSDDTFLCRSRREYAGVR